MPLLDAPQSPADTTKFFSQLQQMMCYWISNGRSLIVLSTRKRSPICPVKIHHYEYQYKDKQLQMIMDKSQLVANVGKFCLPVEMFTSNRKHFALVVNYFNHSTF